MLKRTLLYITLFTLLTPTFSFAREIPFLTPYAELLKEHVTEATLEGIPTTAINYKAWQKDPRHEKAINLLTTDNVGNYKSRELKLSYWINAYNLLVIDLILKEAPKDSIQNLGGIVSDPWNEYSWVIDGLEYNLNYIQHQVLKPLGESRFFFALTCGAISCPSLKATPYWPDRMYTQLEKQTAQFIHNDKKAFQTKHDKKNDTARIQTRDKAYISQLFLWHQKYLEGGNINRFVQRYRSLDNLEIEDYLDFNWNLNAKKGELPNPKLRKPINRSSKKILSE